MDHCIQCGLCKSVCEPHAIDFDDKPKKIELDVGTIIVATGFDAWILLLPRFFYFGI